MCYVSSVSGWSPVFRYGAGQLKVMFIGGPNQRKDYHIEEGEEVSGSRGGGGGGGKLVEAGEEKEC